MRELTDILPTLETPPDGLRRLQRRMSAPAPQRAIRQRFALAAAVIVVALSVTLALPPIMHHQRVDALTRSLRQQMSAGPGPSGIRVDNGAAIALPSHDPQVRVYLIQVGDAHGH